MGAAVLGLALAWMAWAAPGDKVEVKNADFATDENGDGVPDEWGFSQRKGEPTCALEAEGGPEGGPCVRIDCPADGDQGLLTQRVPVEPDTVYRFVAWTKATEGLVVTLSASSYSAESKWLDADYYLIDVRGDGHWVQRAGYYRTNAEAATINLAVWANWHSAQAGSGWFAGIEVTEVDEIPALGYAPENPPFPFNDAEKRRGFTLIRRSYLNLMPRAYRPTAEERLDRIEIAASLGEYEPAMVAVHAARDLEKLTCTVSDLAGAGGAKIGGGDVQVAVVRHMMKPSHYSRKDKWLVPAYLEPKNSQSAEAGRSYQFWVTVHVPEDAAPGEYSGQATVDAGSGEQSVPVRLTVWPIRLREPEGVWFGFYDWHSVVRDVEDPTAWKYADMRAHGLTSVGYCGSSGAKLEGDLGQITVDLSESDLAADFDAYVRAGFPAPIVWLMGGEVRNYASKFGEPGSAEFESAYAEIIRKFNEQGTERGWPTIYYQPQDEVFSKPERFAVALAELRALRKAGVLTEMDGPNTNHETGPQAYALTDMLVNVYGPLFYGERVYSPDEWRDIVAGYHADGKKILYYNFDTTGYHPECMRFSNGFYIAATGNDGILNWAYTSRRNNYGETDPEGVARAITFEFPQTETEAGGPSTGYEGIREGVDDYRYWYTLKTMAAEARRQGKENAAQAAEAVLAHLFDDLDMSGLRTNMSLQGDWTRATTDESLRSAPSGEYKLGISWSKARYDEKRRLLAEAIIKLQRQ